MQQHPNPTINRRHCLTAMLATGTALISGCATTAPNTKTYVLVHGAYHGAWAWDAVKPLLEKPGVRVLAPTLKGLAERELENGPDVNLDTHINEVIALLDKEKLSNVVLVGHSYAGMVVTGVCDQRPERIAHVVYLDAFLPESGQSLYDMVPPAGRALARQGTKDRGQGYKAFPPPAANWGVTGPLLDEINKRMTPQPAMTSEQPLILKRGGPYAVPRRTYIDCTQPSMPPFVPIKARVKTDPRWNYIAVPAGHEVALTHPQLVTDILAGIS
jgi:pimeloyl-ACP methyl ester carboxylesterase